MRVKIFIYSMLFLIFNVNCKESSIEQLSLAKERSTNTLKSAIIGTKYYVDKYGSNSNSGTFLKPFLTIQKGLDAARAGDTVFVKAGTYQEYVTFNNSGIVGNPIVLKKYNGDIVSVDANYKSVYCVYANNKSNLVIDGINVKNSTYYNILFSGCSNVSVKNVKSDLPLLSSAMNIKLEAGSNWGLNITLQDVITYGGVVGVYLGPKLNGVNIIRGKYSYAGLDGINLTSGLVTDTAQFSRNILVDGSETSYNSRQGILTWCLKKATFRNFWSHHNSATGIQIENNSSKILIEDFLCENNSLGGGFETGVWIDDSADCTVRRGTMRNNQTGFRVSNSQNVLAYNLLIYSNTFTKIAADYTNNSSGVNFYSNPIGTTNNLYICSVKLYNSVIYNNGNAYSQRGAMSIQGAGNYIIKNNIITQNLSTSDIYRTGTHTLISDNNLIFNTKAISVYYTPTTNWVAPMTWSAYKTTTGQDAHSINAYPQFINGELKLQSTSPGINGGVNVGLSTDYLGSPIKGLPDIGAFEY